jgi:hypothetical protein
MEWTFDLPALLSQNSLLLTWRDLVEVLLFSVGSYAIIRWLAQDSQKNLVGVFYGLCLLVFAAHLCNLPGVCFVLFLISPLIATIFVLLHEQTLQKNFVALRAITPARAEAPTNWLETLIQASLRGINKSRTVVGIIQRGDSLETFLTLPAPLNAPITDELIDMIINASSTAQPTILLMGQTGTLIALNPRQRANSYDTHHGEQMTAEELWRQNALIITSQSDSIFFLLSPKTRLFEIVCRGKLYDSLPATQALSVLQHNLTAKQEVAAHDFPQYPDIHQSTRP